MYASGLSFACHWPADIAHMKTKTPTRRGQTLAVEKILLQMARCGDDWAGKATSFSGPAEFHFDSLDDLVRWLRKRAGRQLK